MPARTAECVTEVLERSSYYCEFYWYFFFTACLNDATQRAAEECEWNTIEWNSVAKNVHEKTEVLHQQSQQHILDFQMLRSSATFSAERSAKGGRLKSCTNKAKKETAERSVVVLAKRVIRSNWILKFRVFSLFSRAAFSASRKIAFWFRNSSSSRSSFHFENIAVEREKSQQSSINFPSRVYYWTFEGEFFDFLTTTNKLWRFYDTNLRPTIEIWNFHSLQLIFSSPVASTQHLSTDVVKNILQNLIILSTSFFGSIFRGCENRLHIDFPPFA